MMQVGTSGWHYRDWRGAFYPDKLPTRRWLAYYATHYPTVELNNTFYRLPTTDAFRTWRAEVPRDFLFTVKASRYLTHYRRLREPSFRPISVPMSTRWCASSTRSPDACSWRASSGTTRGSATRCTT